MIKWKTIPIVVATAGTEVLMDFLQGKTGKTIEVKYITCPKTASLTLRMYRNGDQIVDFDSNLFTTGWTLLPVDCPIDLGHLLKAGVKDDGAGASTYKVAIGYTETP